MFDDIIFPRRGVKTESIFIGYHFLKHLLSDDFVFWTTTTVYTFRDNFNFYRRLFSGTLYVRPSECTARLLPSHPSHFVILFRPSVRIRVLSKSLVAFILV